MSVSGAAFDVIAGPRVGASLVPGYQPVSRQQIFPDLKLLAELLVSGLEFHGVCARALLQSINPASAPRAHQANLGPPSPIFPITQLLTTRGLPSGFVLAQPQPRVPSQDTLLFPILCPGQGGHRPPALVKNRDRHVTLNPLHEFVELRLCTLGVGAGHPSDLQLPLARHKVCFEK